MDYRARLGRSGKGTVFVRFFLLAVDDGPARLYDCQAKGVGQVEKRGETFSVPYISKLTRELTNLGLVHTWRKGKHYWVELTGDGQDFLQEILKTDWGMSAARSHAEEQTETTDKFLTKLGKHGAVSFTGRIPRPVWSTATDGDHRTVVVHPDAVITVEFRGKKREL